MPAAILCGSPRAAIRHDGPAVSCTRALVEQGVGVVSGGGRVGLMVVDLEVSHGGVTRLEVVASTHERTARMAELADAFIVLLLRARLRRRQWVGVALVLASVAVLSA